MPEAVTSTISTLSGCGITILSQFIHLGVEPKFTVRPNPTNGDIEIASSEDVGDASISIFDMLGRDCGEQSVSLTTGEDAHLAMPAASGLYHLRIESAAGVSFLSVMVNR
jgi:hypothetical protein